MHAGAWIERQCSFVVRGRGVELPEPGERGREADMIGGDVRPVGQQPRP